MKNLLAIVLFCLPAFGQAAYSGSAMYQRTATYGAAACGPPTYSCLNMSTAAVPLPAQIPVWGTTNTPANNTNCTSSNPYVFQQCGNLVGAGIVQTPSDFEMPIIRCTDANTLGYASFWGTRDNGEPNIFASDDSWISLNYGNGDYILSFNGNSCAYTGISYGDQPVQASHTNPNVAYILEGVNNSQLYQDTYTKTGGFGGTWTVASHAELFDFINSYNSSTSTYNCLQNSYNGYPGWTASGANWTGVFTTSQDDTLFVESYGNNNISNSVGVYLAVWKPSYGLNGGCDIWNTVTGTLWKHDGSCNITTPCPMTYQSYSTTPAFSVMPGNASGGTTVYTGTTGGGSNAYVNYSFAVTGCSISADNGTFTASASAAGSVTLSNSAGVSGATGCSAQGTQVGPDMFKQHEGFASAGDSYIPGRRVGPKLHAQWRVLRGAVGVGGRHDHHRRKMRTVPDNLLHWALWGRLQWPRGRPEMARSIHVSQQCREHLCGWHRHLRRRPLLLEPCGHYYPGRRLPGNDWLAGRRWNLQLTGRIDSSVSLLRRDRPHTDERDASWDYLACGAQLQQRLVLEF